MTIVNKCNILFRSAFQSNSQGEARNYFLFVILAKAYRSAGGNPEKAKLKTNSFLVNFTRNFVFIFSLLYIILPLIKKGVKAQKVRL